MSGGTNKSTTTTGINNPALNSTISELAKGVSQAYSPGKSSYVAPTAATLAGQNSSLTAATNPAFANGVNGAIADFADVAAGKHYGMDDPGYQLLRQNAADDALTATDRAFNSAGLFGADSNQKAAGEGVANALAALDYGNYQSDIARQQAAVPILSQLFSSAQLPGSIQQSVGASQQADAQAKLLGPLDYIGKASGALQGVAPMAGTTTTASSPSTPLWQTLLSLGISAL